MPTTVKPAKPFAISTQLCGIRYSPKGDLLIGGTMEGTIRRWTVTAKELTDLPTLTGHQAWVSCVAFDPKADRFYSADSWGKINAWSSRVEDTKPLWSIADAHDGWIHALVVHPKGDLIATGGRDQFVRLADPQTGKEIRRWSTGDDVLAMIFHPSGNTLITGDLHGNIKEWDVATGKLKTERDAKAMFLRDRIQDTGGVRCFAWNSDGSILFAGGCKPKSGGFVQGMHLLISFDWATGKATSTYQSVSDADGFVLDMNWNPAGFLMAVTSGQPGNGKLLFLKPGEAQPFLIQVVPNAHSLAVHPDGKRLLVSATHGNGGNGRNLGANKEYVGNTSPLHGFELTIS